MAVPAYPGAFILGSFAGRVTIYSQQVRALNLVDALCKTGQMAKGTPVAVVGGGIAGLTAAAAAAVRGAEVTLIEKENEFFPIQRHTTTRYLHPHIYDWPLGDRKEGSGAVAKLPLLRWTAAPANAVFDRLDEEWRKLRALYGARQPKQLMETRFLRLDAAAHERLELTVQEKSSSEPTRLTAAIVILALGFGRETERSHLYKYWDNTSLDSPSEVKLRWLVSGYGDGGLTDLMRLCIKSFRHEWLVKRFAGDTKLIQTLKGLLGGSGRKPPRIRDAFEDLYQRVQLLGDSDLRTDTDVTFNAPADYLESEGSSILNKLIVFQLEKLGKFARQDGRMKLPIPQPTAEDRYEVAFLDEKDVVIKTEVFNRLVVRHGPERSLSEEKLPEIWAASEKLRARWKGLAQGEDRTRVPIWVPADYDPARMPGSILTTEVPARSCDLECLVLEASQPREQVRLHGLVVAGLKNQRNEIKRTFGRTRHDPDLVLDFHDLRIDEALASQREYNRTAQLLCRADVAVIDVTGFEPGVMLFLGIRAAVRRGVTLVTNNQRLDAAAWSKLPFNLKELYPLSVLSQTQDANSPEHPARILGATLERALKQYRSIPSYQDLPAYEAVRRLEASRQDAQSVLWLCSFDPEYEPLAAYLQNGFIAELGAAGDDGTTYRLERVTEIVSPQLVTQRLYSAIRRTGLCLVDWSRWSPNVFFELGVRLAVTSMGPVCLVEKPAGGAPGAGDAGIARQREALVKLFHPIEYSRTEDEQELFREIRARYEEMQAHEAAGRAPSPIPPTFGAFSYDHTYRLVGRSLLLSEEPGASTAHAALTASANALIGNSATTDPGLPVLYANVNEGLDRQARSAAVELLIAAWIYLTNRYPPAELKGNGQMLQEYMALTERLSNLLENRTGAKDQELLRRVKHVLDKIDKGLFGGDLP
jgi:hypothetical protein